MYTNEVNDFEEENLPGFQVTALLEFVKDHGLERWIPDYNTVMGYNARYLANSKFWKFWRLIIIFIVCRTLRED